MITAYLLAWIDRRSERILSVGIYSENELQITRVDKAIPARLLEAKGVDYEAAKASLLKSIKNPSYAWVERYLA